jgi:hypothetical protein
LNSPDSDHVDQFIVQCNINIAARYRLTTLAGQPVVVWQTG